MSPEGVSAIDAYLAHVHSGSDSGLRLWDDYQSTALLVALPSFLNIRQRNTLGVRMKLRLGSMRHDFL